MQDIDKIGVHSEHKEEMRKAAEFLIDRDWAQDPIVITEDEPIWQEIQKESSLWSFVSGFEKWDFMGHKSHIKGRRWFDGQEYYWFVLVLPVDPDDAVGDSDDVAYMVIDRDVAYRFSFPGMIDYLLRDF